MFTHTGGGFGSTGRYDGVQHIHVKEARTTTMPKMFGTDGVRGLANKDLTARLALDLGDAAVRVLKKLDAQQGANR